jgi:hypothetical protein
MLLLVVIMLSAVAVQGGKECIAIYGYSSCAFFKRAECWGKSLDAKEYQVEVVGGTRPEYQDHLTRLKALHPSIDQNHRTSPMVMHGCAKPQYIGGSDDFVAWLKARGVPKPAECW